MKKLRIKLADILEERNIKQSQLAELADIRPNAISNLCRGYVDRLSIAHIEKICDALKLNSLDDLFELVDNEKDDGN